MLIIDIPETRGRKPETNFFDMELGETRKIKNSSSSVVINCAKSQAKTRKLPYKFKVYKQKNIVSIVRVQ